MKKTSKDIEPYRIVTGAFKSSSNLGMSGAFIIPFESYKLRIISDDGSKSQWEHVSISLKNRCPNWKEMCFVKNLFWDEEETVIQYHPPKSKHINFHPFVLHLWKPVNIRIPLPPTILIGPSMEQT